MADVTYGVQIKATADGFDAASAATEALADDSVACTEALADLEDAADKANEAIGDISGATKSLELGKLKSGLADIGGPLGKLSSKAVGAAEGFGKLKATLGPTAGGIAAVGLGAAAAAVAIAVLVAAVGAAAIGIAAWGVGLANTRRELELTYEGLAAADPALAGLGETAASVSKATGVSQQQLQQFAKQLSAAGVSAADMKTALMAVATAEGAVAGAGADVMNSIKSGTASLDEVAAKANETYGGVLAKRMMGIDAQSKTLKANIGEIFGGLKIEPVLAAMATLVGVFDSTSATGQTLKWAFESLFQPLLDMAPAAAYAIEALIIGIMIGGLKIYIAFKPAISAVKELIGSFGGGASEIDWLGTIVSVGEMIAPVIMVAVVAFGALAVGLAGAAAMAMAVPMAIVAIIGVVGSLVPSIISFVGGMVSAGKDLIVGLAKGITDGGAAVLGAITGVVGGAISGAKKMLGIASPSKVFAAIGEDTADGMAIGVDKASDAPIDAMSAMVQPPELPASAPAASGASTTRNGGPVTININAPSGDAKSIAEAVRAVLRDLIDDDAIVMGAA